MDVTAKPKPRVTPDNRPFWDGCRAHVLKLPWCVECGRAFLPPAPRLPAVLRRAPRVAGGERTGHGLDLRGRAPALVSGLRRAISPYNVAQVELEEGPRLTTSLVGIANEDIGVGLEVEAVFDDLDDETTLPRFRPRGPG